STRTSHPASASRFAATRPLWPAPMTTASTVSSAAMSEPGSPTAFGVPIGPDPTRHGTASRVFQPMWTGDLNNVTVAKTVVVTGATGNVGTALLRQLTTTDEVRVIGVARRVPEPDAEPYRNVHWVPCDLGEPDAVDTLTTALDGADVVVHLAWAIHPRQDEPSLWRTNVTGTRYLLQAIARTGADHVIAGSSVAAYTPAPHWSRVSENWATDGIGTSAYSRSK